jgi:predicted DNA-binding transcriptional regulator AlpA
MTKKAAKVDEVVALSDEEARALIGEPLLTTEQVAQLLHCSVSNLNKLRWAGKGPPFVRIGANIRYRPADIAAFIAAGMSDSTSEEPPPAA